MSCELFHRDSQSHREHNAFTVPFPDYPLAQANACFTQSEYGFIVDVLFLGTNEIYAS